MNAQEPEASGSSPLEKATAWERLIAGIHAQLVMGRRVRRLTHHISDFLPPEATVLDIGTGSGEIALALIKSRPDLTIAGLDVQARPGAAIPVQAFDGRHIPAEDDSWDTCMMIDVLHHCTAPRALLGEAARVARASVVIKDHVAAGSFDGFLLRVMDWFGNRGHRVAMTYDYLSWPKWERMFDEEGLMIVAIERRLGLYPYPFRWLLDRNLHFIARIEIGGNRGASRPEA